MIGVIVPGVVVVGIVVLVRGFGGTLVLPVEIIVVIIIIPVVVVMPFFRGYGGFYLGRGGDVALDLSRVDAVGEYGSSEDCGSEEFVHPSLIL
jgi:hypothetical protein